MAFSNILFILKVFMKVKCYFTFNIWGKYGRMVDIRAVYMSLVKAFTVICQYNWTY